MFRIFSAVRNSQKNIPQFNERNVKYSDSGIMQGGGINRFSPLLAAPHRAATSNQTPASLHLPSFSLSSIILQVASRRSFVPTARILFFYFFSLLVLFCFIICFFSLCIVSPAPSIYFYLSHSQQPPLLFLFVYFLSLLIFRMRTPDNKNLNRTLHRLLSVHCSSPQVKTLT